MCVGQQESVRTGITASNFPEVPLGLGLKVNTALGPKAIDQPDFIPVFTVNTMRMLLPMAKVRALFQPTCA